MVVACFSCRGTPARYPPFGDRPHELCTTIPKSSGMPRLLFALASARRGCGTSSRRACRAARRRVSSGVPSGQPLLRGRAEELRAIGWDASAFLLADARKRAAKVREIRRIAHDADAVGVLECHSDEAILDMETQGIFPQHCWISSCVGDVVAGEIVAWVGTRGLGHGGGGPRARPWAVDVHCIAAPDLGNVFIGAQLRSHGSMFCPMGVLCRQGHAGGPQEN